MPRGTHRLSARAWRVPGWRAVASRRPAFVAEPRPGGRFSVPARAHLLTRRASRARRLEGATGPATPRARSRSRIGRRESRAAAKMTTPRASRRLETSPERRSKSRRTPVRWTRSPGGPARFSGRRKRPPRRPRWPTSSRVTRAARNRTVSCRTRRRVRRASKVAGRGSNAQPLELEVASWRLSSSSENPPSVSVSARVRECDASARPIDQGVASLRTRKR